MDAQALAALDSTGLEVLDAIAHVKAPPMASLTTPHAFLTSAGSTCWVKAQSQYGLETELIAGRLASAVGAGPMAHVVDVPAQALPPGGIAGHLHGVLVGTEDVAASVNNRELHLVGVTTLDPRVLDASQRAVVVTFQTWIGLDDLQVLIDLRSGRVMSHDHGGCFSNTTSAHDPGLALLELPGIDRAHGRDGSCLAAAVARVESLSDDDLLRAVSRVPTGPGWNPDPARRLQIAEWLAERRDRIAEVMKTW